MTDEQIEALYRFLKNIGASPQLALTIAIRVTLEIEKERE
jgi:hypothetical protein